MSGETYVKRYPGGFVDLPAQTTAIDSQFLNAVEQALVRLLGEDPGDGEVPAWSAGLGRLVYQTITNAQVAPGAAISRTKLDFGAGLVDADVAPGAAISSSKISGLTGGTIPPGVMVSYGGTTPPSGWLLCDGSAVSRATYAGIFSVVGVAYGVGDGSTTFNLPDFRGRTFVGVGTHADVSALGLSDGQAVGNRRPKHNHSVTLGTLGTGTDSPDHSHAMSVWSATGGATQAPPTTASNTIALTLSTQGASARHTHAVTGVPTVGPQTGSEPTDSEAYLTASVIIKT